ncbi:MAG: glycosyltransferase [Acidobacteria bacterium]|nr:glycosyltransferase [Acidobacteriota bacterium]
MTPSCTVIICTRDRAHELESCLTAVTQLSYPRFSVLVVDSASRGDATRDMAQRFNVGYLRLAAPGLSYARNQGARASSSEFVAYLDDDAVPCPGWLSALLSGFSEACVDAVTGRIMPLRVESEAEQMSASTDRFLRRNDRVIFDRSLPNWFEVASFGDIGRGGNMAFRRSVFDSWNGFDERLGRGAPLVGGEELYAFSQLISGGSAIVYVPTAIVRHPYPASIKDLRSRRYQSIQSAAAYFAMLIAEERKHWPELWRVISNGFSKRLGNRIDPQERPFRSVLGRWMTVRAIAAGVFKYASVKIAQRFRRYPASFLNPSAENPPTGEHTPGSGNR